MKIVFLILAPMLYWIAVGGDSYDIRYAIEPIDESTWKCATQLPNAPTPNAFGELDSCAVPSGGYFFALKTVNAFGESDLSNVVKDVKCDTTNIMQVDVNCDDSPDISDLIWMIDFMFGPIK